MLRILYLGLSAHCFSENKILDLNKNHANNFVFRIEHAKNFVFRIERTLLF